jgi:hypothetical protein
MMSSSQEEGEKFESGETARHYFIGSAIPCGYAIVLRSAGN